MSYFDLNAYTLLKIAQQNEVRLIWRKAILP